MKTELNKGQHPVYLLTYHPVLVVKYRHKAITEQIAIIKQYIPNQQGK
jgi:REP element-mobilizing transposase RayT